MLSSLLLPSATASSGFVTEEFSFHSSGLTLNGIISRPKGSEASSIAILVPGHGPTNVVEGDWYRDIRSKFTAKGVAVLLWDKPGCGKSEGEFDLNQSIESSAEEVLAAVHALKQKKEAGSDRIGLLGFSRGGWIAPLAISRDPSITFWISVSGTDAFESWGYLLRSSMEIGGYPSSEIDAAYQGWLQGNLVFGTGGDYEHYLTVSRAFRRNELVQKLTGQQYVEHEPGTEEYEAARNEYLDSQKVYTSEEHTYDEESGLLVIIPGFDQILKSISNPVLAIFGDNDRHVDWRKTKALYERTIGVNEQSTLSIKVFKGADHALRMSKTGGFFETMAEGYWNNPLADGYHEAMVDWLCSNGFCSGTP